MKNKWLQYSISAMTGVIVIGLISSRSSLFLYMSDSYFVIGLTLMIIGLFSWVLKEGTFDFFHYSLNKKKEKTLDTNEFPNKDNLHRLSRSIPSTYRSFIKAGSLFLVCSTLCMLIYFFQNN